jgi:hypothetical protein
MKMSVSGYWIDIHVAGWKLSMILQSAGQRAEWRCGQETCDFDCFIFFCWSLYISLLWFHVSLHLMLKFMYVHMYTSMQGSMTASNSCLSFRHLCMKQSCFHFFIKQTVESFIPYNIWLHQFSIPWQTYVTPLLPLTDISLFPFILQLFNSM